MATVNYACSEGYAQPSEQEDLQILITAATRQRTTRVGVLDSVSLDGDQKKHAECIKMLCLCVCVLVSQMATVALAKPHPISKTKFLWNYDSAGSYA